MTRRQFLATTSTLAAFSIVPRHVLGAGNQPAPSEKMNVGCVGVGGMQGANDVRSVSRENIYALGRKFTPAETVERVVGGPIDPQPYLRYLRGKLETPAA